MNLDNFFKNVRSQMDSYLKNSLLNMDKAVLNKFNALTEQIILAKITKDKAKQAQLKQSLKNLIYEVLTQGLSEAEVKSYETYYKQVIDVLADNIFQLLDSFIGQFLESPASHLGP